MKPKVAFIGTGGTIASVGVGPLDLQDYGATGKVMHADEIIARWPETALVADVHARALPQHPQHGDRFHGLEGAGAAVRDSWSRTIPISPASSSATAPRRWRKPPISST